MSERKTNPSSEDAMRERIPPQSRDAERCVLGSMLRDNAVIADVLDLLDADAFYFDAHQKIFRAIAGIHRAGSPVDLVILADALKTKNQIDDVGGYIYLGELWDAAPTAANGVHYAGIVHENAGLRNLMRAATEILRDAQDQAAPFDDLAAEAQRKMTSIGGRRNRSETRTLAEVLIQVQMGIDRRAANPELCGVVSGWRDLDELTAGFLPGELCVVAARPSVGKSAFAANICQHVGGMGTPCLIYSLEMTCDELGMRLLCGEAKVNSYAIRRGRLTAADFQAIGRAAAVLSPLPMHINAVPRIKIGDVVREARRKKARDKIGLLVVDYLQLVPPDDERASTNDQIARISRELKLLAVELEIPIICLSQLNRESESRADARPKLSDLRGSGSIEQDANTVIFLHRPVAKDAQQLARESAEPIEVIIAKQRNGPLGETKLIFRKRAMRFEDYNPGMLE